MKLAKNKTAFTLAELMVIMSVMTVILAAVAPIFTSRYTGFSLDNVWDTVAASNSNDIFADAPARTMIQQILIGITPKDLEDVRTTYQPYSKLIVRSTNQVDGIKFQKQIEFRRNGDRVGYLFAANSNILLGGNYNHISFQYKPSNLNDITKMNIGTGASGNTALGRFALDSITTGQENSAFGYEALNKLTSGSYNVGVGVGAGSKLTEGNANVLIGYNSYNDSKGDYNTVIGNNSASRSSESYRVTAIGNEINVKGSDNVAIGNNSNAGGQYNTALGYAALLSQNPQSDSYSNFKNNTAIGYKACSGISSSASNKTCIGGHGVDNSVMSSTAKSFFGKDNVERVFIGGPTSAFNSAATLEVHNPSGASSRYPYPYSAGVGGNLGNASVVVNGNLIVRGQTYMLGRSPFPLAPNASSSTYANTISLMGYRLYKESPSPHKPLIGMDGSEYTQRIMNNDGLLHEKVTGREHCICAYSCSISSKDYQGHGYYGRDSYNWSYLSSTRYFDIFNNLFDGYSYYWGSDSHRCGSSYNNTSYESANSELDRAHNAIRSASDITSAGDLTSGNSCCPILTVNGSRKVEDCGASGVCNENCGNYNLIQCQELQNTSSDIRLKNIAAPFNDGINFLSKLKVYNYVFKNDISKISHVGVIAQDLKRIFPNAVSKDDKGYYQIRKEDMFFTAINSVKELYGRLAQLTNRIENYIVRITALKKENIRLKAKLLYLSNELDKLEK